MQQSNLPAKLTLPFATNGVKNSIPVASQILVTPGAASYGDGFPPLTRTPIAAGGVPPSGQDMNGILFEHSSVLRWLNAGGSWKYDATFAADSNIGGYPKGSQVLRADYYGFWRSLIDNNSTNPEVAGAGAHANWVRGDGGGDISIALTSTATYALAPAQYGCKHITFTGTPGGTVNITFPGVPAGLVCEWIVTNSTDVSIFANSNAGVNVQIAAGQTAHVYVSDSKVYAITTNANGGNLLGVQVFTASGTYTPTPGTKFVIVEAVGGGGAGGGTAATSTGQCAATGGGGAGAYGMGKFTGSFAGVTVTVGAAGTGVAGGTGGNGTTTSFGALMSCPGGIGAGAGAATATGTSQVFSAAGISTAPSGGNIFQSTGKCGSPAIMAGVGIVAGAGGDSQFGPGGAWGFPAGSGYGAAGYGAGGGGRVAGASESAGIGGSGKAGLVIVREYA